MSKATIHTIRTVMQSLVALAAVAPLIASASGIPESTAIVAGFVAVAGAVTRVMAIPAVDRWLASVGLGITPDTPTE